VMGIFGISSDAIDRSGEHRDGTAAKRAGFGITEEISPPLRFRHLNAVASPAMIRRLTPLECERLQGFPDGWSCFCQPLAAYAADPDAAARACRCPDSPRYRAMGNAVTVPVIFWLGQRLLGQWQ
jgi:DNA (cytosine-5)-methyltransferase 1